MKSKSPILTLFLLLAAATSGVAQQFNTAFTYQGRLTDRDRPATGAYDLQFNLWDAAALGGQVGGNVAIAPVAVSNGLFMVTLDFGAVAFSGSTRWLQISVRTNGSLAAYTVQAPRQAITAAPYAIYAATGGTVPDSAITSAKLAPGAVTAAKLATNAVTSMQLSDDIELGSASANGELTLWNRTNDVESIRLFGASHQIRLHGSDGAEQLRLDGKAGGALLLFDRDNSNQTVTLDSGTFFFPFPPPGTYADRGGSLTLASLNGAMRASLSAPSFGGELSLFESNGTETVEIIGAESGNAGGQMRMRQANGTTTVEIQGAAANLLGGQMLLKQADGSTGVRLAAEVWPGLGGWLSLNGADGTSGLILQADDIGAGSIQVRNGSGSTRVLVDGQSTGSGGEISVLDATGTETVEILGAESTSAGSQILMRQANGTNTIQLDAEAGAEGGGYLALYKGDGRATIVLRADSSGAGRITTQVLEITGGADLSEQFDINPTSLSLEPGMIVCIDPANPGKLVPSTSAYDRT
ncbi:MAG TPA: hypothetical protein VGQ71_15150, partial [Terriglobales bacterium]|nr:hypothetical protein [Terriglobales bacterium]